MRVDKSIDFELNKSIILLRLVKISKIIESIKEDNYFILLLLYFLKKNKQLIIKNNVRSLKMIRIYSHRCVDPLKPLFLSIFKKISRVKNPAADSQGPKAPVAISAICVAEAASQQCRSCAGALLRLSPSSLHATEISFELSRQLFVSTFIRFLPFFITEKKNSLLKFFYRADS